MASKRCSGHSKRTGKPCEAWAIRGGTVCVSHGGAAGQVKRKAAQRVATDRAQQALSVLGAPRNIDPHAALLEEVHRTAGHVGALELIVSELERERLVGGVTKTVQAPDGGRTVTVQVALNIWLELYRAERKHLLDSCATAIRCGVERKRVELEERQGVLIAQVFRAVFEDPELAMGAAQRRAAMVATARHLRLVSGDAA